jgi:hypothetical protein
VLHLPVVLGHERAWDHPSTLAELGVRRLEEQFGLSILQRLKLRVESGRSYQGEFDP